MNRKQANYVILAEGALDPHDAKTASCLIRYRPDAVLAATQFENLTGFQIARDLKENPRYRDIPVILLAEAPSEEDEQHAKAAGAEACFVKHGKYENAITFFLSAYLDRKAGETAAREEEAPREGS